MSAYGRLPERLAKVQKRLLSANCKLQRTIFTMFHYADDTNELGFRTDSERSGELIKFRTEPIPNQFRTDSEPIPKNFSHSVPNRTEI